MPDRRLHRGPHPEDRRLFGEAALPALRGGVADLSWLLSRGYSIDASLKLVGDRYGLRQRQRIALARCAASDDAVSARQARRRRIEDVAGRELLIDGYNLLTTIEAALAGGVILLGRDGCFRDMASMHGTYRKVSETLPAMEKIGQAVGALAAGEVHWLLDSPVSNSGRLAAMLREHAPQRGRPWTVEVAANPDRKLVESKHHVIVTADSAVLDACGAWLNLARHIVEQIPVAWIVDLS